MNVTTAERPFAAKRIDGAWFVVLTTHGRHFYHEKSARLSQWTMPVEVIRCLGLDEEEVRRKEARVAEMRVEATAGDTAESSDATVGNVIASEDEYEFGEEDVERQLGIQMAEERVEEVGVEATFLELLRERGVDAFAMWADVERTLADDPRFDVATAKQRKDAFAVYCQQVAAPTSIASGPPAVDGKKRVLDAYRALLAAEVTPFSRWDGFQRKCRRDKRFTDVPSHEREAMFREHLKQVKGG